MDKKDHDKALNYMEKSLKMSKKTIKSEQRYIANSLFGIGEVYRKLHKPKSALKNFNEVLDIREKIYPKDHKKIIETKQIIKQTVKDNLFSVLYL
jgi:tetratricopeptide (TPR) repeat protein